MQSIVLPEAMAGDDTLLDKGLAEPLLDGDYDASEALIDTEDETSWPEVKSEAFTIMNLAMQIALQSMCSYGMTFFSVAFVGRLGAFALSVSALATSMYNVTGLSILVGFNTAMDTLCGQAYGGGNYEKVGIVLQRGTGIATVGFVIFSLMYTQMETLLLWLGQDPVISHAAARYMWLMVPGLAAAVSGDLMKRYLMAQTVVLPSMIATAVATALSPIYNWYFIYYLDWGLDGAAVAYGAAMLTMAVLTLAVILYRDHKLKGTPEQTWHGWSKRGFSGWGQYMSLATPATIMVCLEWWTSEVIIIFAGWLHNPNTQVAVLGSSVQLMYLLSRFAMGLASGTAIRTANLLGANKPRMAKHAYHIGFAYVNLVELIICVTMYVLRDSIGYIFTDDEEVVQAVSGMMSMTALAMFFDCTQCVVRAVLQGSGNQKTGAILNVFSYWVIGVPACYIFGFPMGYGVKGLMGGFALASVLQGLFLVIIVERLDFKLEAHKAHLRINTSSIAAPEQLGEEFANKLELLRDTMVRAGSVSAPLMPGVARGITESLNRSRRAPAPDV